jgi:hypothetical protein
MLRTVFAAPARAAFAASAKLTGKVQATAGEERRVDRAELRAQLRYGWDETDASAGTPEHSQATFDSRRSVQSELDLPHPVGIWYPTRTEKSTVLACSYASLAA